MLRILLLYKKGTLEIVFKKMGYTESGKKIVTHPTRTRKWRGSLRKKRIKEERRLRLHHQWKRGRVTHHYVIFFIMLLLTCV